MVHLPLSPEDEAAFAEQVIQAIEHYDDGFFIRAEETAAVEWLLKQMQAVVAAAKKGVPSDTP